jgi:hypothetical protein
MELAAIAMESPCALQRSDHANMPDTPGTWRRFYHDFDVPAEQVEKVNESFGRKICEIPTQQTRYLGLVDPQQLCCGGLGKAALADSLIDARRKFCLRELFFGVCQAEVGKNIAASNVVCDFLNHARRSLSALSTTLRALPQLGRALKH